MSLLYTSIFSDHNIKSLGRSVLVHNVIDTYIVDLEVLHPSTF